jgi:signal transduction histidine kinase
MRAQAIEKLKEVQEEIRGISHELSDAAYQKFHNFIISLEELITGICEAAGLGHRFDYDKETDWDGLQGEVKINLYRIIQECLQNTIKHAQASEVVVEMISEPYMLRVNIRDNGVGFHPTRGKKGIGQKNIESRVKKLGGRWQLRSKPGQGTEVALQLPHHGGHPLASNTNVGSKTAHAAERIEIT